MYAIGHRGAAGHAPENTLVSVEAALELGADWIEIDVQATADGELVVFHDKLLDSNTNAHGFLAELTLEELERQVRMEGRQPIPRLRQVCDLLRPSDRVLLVELIDVGAARATAEMLVGTLGSERSVVACFHHPTLVELRRNLPAIRTMALIEGVPLRTDHIFDRRWFDMVGIGFESANQGQIDELRELRLELVAWTINHPLELRRAAAMGFDGIISDYPERVVALRHEGFPK